VLDEQANSPDIWIFELARGTFARVTSDPATDWFPVWAKDGDRVFFGSARTRATSLFQRQITGNAREEALATPEYARYPLDVTSDGHLLFQEGRADGYDLAMLNLAEKGTSTPLLTTRSAKCRRESRPTIAGSRMPPTNPAVSRSTFAACCRRPPVDHFARRRNAAGVADDGRELFYISRDRKLMAVPVTTGGETFSAGVLTHCSTWTCRSRTHRIRTTTPRALMASVSGQRWSINRAGVVGGGIELGEARTLKCGVSAELWYFLPRRCGRAREPLG
jgi:hypothetical protein